MSDLNQRIKDQAEPGLGHLLLTPMSTYENLTTVIDLLQSDAAAGPGQERGVEARYGLPPATLQSLFNSLGLDDSYKVTYIDRSFPLRLCKASGLRKYIGGGAGNILGVA